MWLVAEGVRDQAEGVFGLPVGQPVRAGFPVREHSEPCLVVFVQADQGLVHPGQVSRAVIGLGQAHAGQQGPDPQLAGAHPDRQHGLDPRRDAGGIDDRLEHRQRGHERRTAPSSLTASASPAGSSPATRSPSRWEQLIPAACMNVASPSSCAQSASHVARSREVSSRGRPGAAVQRGDQRVRDVPPGRIGPAADQRGPGEPGCGQQPGVVAGQHRNRARPGAAHKDNDPAGPGDHVAAARVAQVAADQPGTRAQADQPGRAHPPLRSGLGVRQREIAADLRRAVRLLGPLPRQRQISRIQLRHDPPADEPQVRAQRAARHARQPRRAPGEPLGNRRVQHHPGHQVQAQRRRVIGEFPHCPQQVLRPLPPLRPALVITSRANAAACGDTDDGSHRPI